MNSMVLYCPKNNIYILGDNEYREIFTTLASNRKLHSINEYCYKKREYPRIQLILNLQEKDNIVYTTLSSALKELNDGVCEYKISKAVCNKVINIINLKSCVNQINISKYSDYHEYLSCGERTMLKLIN